MGQESQTRIVISHRNEESAFMLRLFFALKGFEAEIQKSTDLALFSDSNSGTGAVLVCDASDQTLVRAEKKTGERGLHNVVVIRDNEQVSSSCVRTSPRVISSSTIGTDLIGAVLDCFGDCSGPLLLVRGCPAQPQPAVAYRSLQPQAPSLNVIAKSDGVITT